MAWHREWHRRNPELEPFVSGPRGLLGQTVQAGDFPALERVVPRIPCRCCIVRKVDNPEWSKYSNALRDHDLL